MTQTIPKPQTLDELVDLIAACQGPVTCLFEAILQERAVVLVASRRDEPLSPEECATFRAPLGTLGHRRVSAMLTADHWGIVATVAATVIPYQPGLEDTDCLYLTDDEMEALNGNTPLGKVLGSVRRQHLNGRVVKDEYAETLGMLLRDGRAVATAFEYIPRLSTLLRPPLSLPEYRTMRNFLTKH